LQGHYSAPARNPPVLGRRRFKYGILSLGLLLLAFCFLLFPVGIVQTSSGKSALVQRAWELSNKGIDNNNQAEAIGILLRLATNLYEGSKISGVHSWFVALLITAIGAICFGTLCPRSVLGIGLGCRRLKRYRRIGRLTNWLVAVWLFAIATSFLGSWLYDLLKSSGQ
jgi:hypothetical protein